MSLKLGSTSIGSLYLGSTKIGAAYLGNVKVYEATLNPNPLNLPDYTIRFECKPYSAPTVYVGTVTRVSYEPNLWDWTYQNSDWSLIFSQKMSYKSSVTKIVGANTRLVTNMFCLFSSCDGLTSVAYFDTSSVTAMDSMFSDCTSLTSAPSFDLSSSLSTGCMFSGCTALTSVGDLDCHNANSCMGMFQNCSNLATAPNLNISSATNMSYIFYNCSKMTNMPTLTVSNSINDVSHAFEGCTSVLSGSYALYQQLSALPNLTQQSKYQSCFKNCGSGTTTGAAELAQIPYGWKL